MKYVVGLVTAPNREEAEKIATALVEKKLAACVNFLGPIHSLFSWQGQISTEDEVLLMVKTRADLFEEQLIPAVQGLHPYEVPEIIALPILMGSKSYLNWIDEETLD
jgi:periplasmic divalent cation tolerance protein